MSGIATAIAGSAIIGGIASDRASSRAADTAAETSDAQLAYMRDAENRAREDIDRLFPLADESRRRGAQQQMDILSQTMPATIDFMQQGNVGAQGVLAGGMPQIQNAIMGGPVNYDFLQPQQMDYQSTLQDLLSGVPSVWTQPTAEDPALPTTPGVQPPTTGFPRGYPGIPGGAFQNLGGMRDNMNPMRQNWRLF